MIGKSAEAVSFYRLLGPSGGGGEAFESLPTTAGPWSPEAQHGGPPAALLTRAIESLGEGLVGRFTMDLLGPVPVGPLRVTARVERPGRSVSLRSAEVYDVARDRPVAAARAWVFPAHSEGPGKLAPPGHGPEDGVPRDRPEGWSPGYIDAVEWRWVEGGLQRPGPGVVWMRPPTLVEGEPISPMQRLMACVDSASGASAMLDVREWGFLNTELTVHVLREPVGEWLCLDAETMLGPGSVGVATSRVWDREGLVARSAQALLVQAR